MEGMTPLAPGAGGSAAPSGIQGAEGAELFGFRELRRLSWRRRTTAFLARRPRLLALAARPLHRFLSLTKNTAVVTGYDAVQEVLRDARSFPVPFGERFIAMDRTGENFILGMNREAEYAPTHGEAMRAFRFEDLPKVASDAARWAEDAVERAAPDGRIDAMAGLLTKVPVRLVRSYYGIPMTEDVEEVFPLWTMAMSTWAFAGPLVEPQDERAAKEGAARLGRLVHRAVKDALDSRKNDDETILGRLVAARRQRLDGETLLNKHALRATMVGLITGFVPTNSKASANILDVLLRHPDMLRAAEAAAKAGDDELLARCLFEALRFRPALPGIFRRCVAERALPNGKRVKEGRWVWALTELAAFDKARVKQPWRFDPERGEADSLGFGFGQHRCFGVALARAQIAATFKPLLLRGGLRELAGKYGKPTTFCTFVEHHRVAFGQGAPR